MAAPVTSGFKANQTLDIALSTFTQLKTPAKHDKECSDIKKRPKTGDRRPLMALPNNLKAQIQLQTAGSTTNNLNVQNSQQGQFKLHSAHGETGKGKKWMKPKPEINDIKSAIAKRLNDMRRFMGNEGDDTEENSREFDEVL
jgi:hypothetical protein